jgi:DNA-binding SARP family transcriptional activator
LVRQSERLRRGNPEAGSGFARAQLHLLHAFRLTSGGRDVDLALPAQRVVAFLALRERPVSRLLVAGALWSDYPESRAFGSLRSALWSLRRSGVELIETTSRQLRLWPEVTVDVREVHEWARRAIDGLNGPPWEELPEAHALGDLLPDWYDEWVLLERERLHQLVVHALESLCERLTSADRFAQALDLGLDAIERDPLRESAHRAVIKVHLAEGNHGEALRHYDLYRRFLHARVGLPPSEQMQSLVRAFAPPDFRA